MPMSALPNAAYFDNKALDATQAAQAADNPAIYMSLLKHAKDNEGAYMQAVQQAQQVEQNMNTSNNQKDVATSYMAALPNLADKGIARGTSIGANPYFGTDSGVMAQGDQIHADDTVAGAQEKRMSAMQKAADMGFVNKQAIANTMGGPLGPPNPVQPYLTPKAKAEEETAAAAMESAKAHMLSAKTGHGAGDTQTTISIIGPDGTPTPMMVTDKHQKHGVQDNNPAGGDGLVPITVKGSNAVRRVTPTTAMQMKKEGTAY